MAKEKAVNSSLQNAAERATKDPLILAQLRESIRSVQRGESLTTAQVKKLIEGTSEQASPTPDTRISPYCPDCGSEFACNCEDGEGRGNGKS